MSRVSLDALTAHSRCARRHPDLRR